MFMKANSTRKLKKYKIIKKRKERNRNTHESRWCNYQQTTYSAATASRRQCLAVWNSMEIRYTRPLFWALFCFGIWKIQNPFVITASLIRWPEDCMILNCPVCSVLSPLCALCFAHPPHPQKAKCPPTLDSPSCVIGLGGRHARG